MVAFSRPRRRTRRPNRGDLVTVPLRSGRKITGAFVRKAESDSGPMLVILQSPHEQTWIPYENIDWPIQVTEVAPQGA